VPHHCCLLLYAAGAVNACLQAQLPADVSDVGFKQAMQQRWVALDKSAGEPRVVRKVRSSSSSSSSSRAALPAASACEGLLTLCPLAAAMQAAATAAAAAAYKEEQENPSTEC
jgi:hypothetical protein